MTWFWRSLFGPAPALVLALAAAAGTAAQTAIPQSAVRFELGAAVRGQTDLMASPLAYRGVGTHVAMAYEQRRHGRQFTVEGSVARARLTSRISDGADHTESTFVANVSVRSLHDVGAAKSGRLHFYAGGQLDLRVPVRSHAYVEGMTEYYADIFLPLQAAGGWEAALGPVVVSERLALPLLAIVGRCPYTGLRYTPVFSVAPPGRLLGFDHALAVERPAGGRMAVRLEWRTTLVRYPVPRTLSMVSHRVGLSVALSGRGFP